MSKNTQCDIVLRPLDRLTYGYMIRHSAQKIAPTGCQQNFIIHSGWSIGLKLIPLSAFLRSLRTDVTVCKKPEISYDRTHTSIFTLGSTSFFL